MQRAFSSFILIGCAVTALVLVTPIKVEAFADLSSSFTLDGQLSDQSLGGPLLDGDIRISVQILDPLKQCVLFEEIHKVSTTSTNGYYRLLVGSSALTAPADASVFPRRGPLDSSHTLTRVSQNTSALSAKGGSCGGSNYTPQSGEGRFLRLIVTPSSLGIAHQLSPDTELGAVPQAMVAESVQGYKANQLLIVDATKNMTQGSVSGFFAALDVNGGKIPASLLPALPTSSLTGVAVGNTGKYLSGDGTWQDLPSGTVPAWNDVTGKPATFPPSTHTHAVGDITGVLTISQGGTGLSAACSDGQVLKSASGAWVCGSDDNTITDTTKLPLTGGTLSGALNMGSQNIESAGHITISSQRTLRFGGMDNANQGALGLNPGHAGSTWYNSDRKALTYWDGLAVREVVGLSTPGSTENGQSLRWNNTSGRWEYFTAGAAGAGIATLNGLAGNDQLFAVSTSASVLTPTWSSVGTTHTLQIPLANQASVTAGLVTNAELAALQAKQSALTAGLDGHFLKSNGTTWSPANITFADIKNNSSGNAFDLANCGSGKTIEWISTLDRIQCADIAISQSQVTGLTAALADKADASAMTTALAAKVETTALTAALSGKADATAMTTALSGKADTTALANYIPASQREAAGGVAGLDLSGRVSLNRLGSGTASGTSYLRGDGTWATLPTSGTVTSIATGDGLTTSDGNAIVGSGIISIANAGVTTAKIGDDQVTSDKLSNDVEARLLPASSGVLADARLPASAKLWQPTTPSGPNISYSAGKVGIGTSEDYISEKLDVRGTDESVRLNIQNSDSTSGHHFPGIRISNYMGSFATGGVQNGFPSILLVNRRGNAGAPAGVILNDSLGSLAFGGTFSSSYDERYGATLGAVAEGDFSSTSAPTSLVFSTTRVNEVDPTEKMRITPSGNIGIGISTPDERLEVAGKVKATEFCIGASCLSAWPSGALTDGSVTTAKLATEVSDKLLPSTAPTGQFLKSNGTAWSGSMIKLDDIKNSSGGASAFNFSACGPSKTLGAFSAPLDQFACVDIANLGSSALSDGSITDVKIATGISASKLTGTLPALSGVNLTNLNASQLVSGTVPPARLPAASGSQDGIVNQIAQSFAGVKTFISNVGMQGALSVTGEISSSSKVSAPALQVTSGSPGDGKVLTSDASGNATWQAPTGGGMRGYKAVSANYTVVAGDAGHLLDVTNGGIVTLPSAVAVGVGFVVSIKRTATNDVTITTTSAQVIDGLLQYNLRGQYSGAVFVSTGSHWIVESRTTSSDPCMVDTPFLGTVCLGGAIYLGVLSSGSMSGKDYYMTTPGNCTDSVTPVCNNGTDALTKKWGVQGADTSLVNTVGNDPQYGSHNTQVLKGLGSLYEAATYCDNLVYGGYDDWYLPNKQELNLFWTNKTAMAQYGLKVTGSSYYWSSSENDNSDAWNQEFGAGNLNCFNCSTKNRSHLVRCVRRF